MLSIVDVFSQVKDPRMERTKEHKLVDIISIAICGILAGAKGYNEIADWGRAKELWLRKFLDLRNGIPSHDTFNRIFSLINPNEFQKAFCAWVSSINVLLDGKIVAIDGKTIRRSHDQTKNKRALHLVSAWAHEAKLSLGQVQVDEKSNEITAIPELLHMLELKGAIVTLDAMGCQKEIAKQIVEKGADYVLALKKNHGDLYDDVETYFKHDGESLPNVNYSIEKDHGRLETRTVSACENIQWLNQKNDWSQLKTIVQVKSTRETILGKQASIRYFLTSLPMINIAKIAYAIRSHWSIENSLHWSLDVLFAEDQSRVRNRNAAQSLALLRKMALSTLKSDSSIDRSLRRKQFLASLDDEYMLHLIGVKVN